MLQSSMLQAAKAAPVHQQPAHLRAEPALCLHDQPVQMPDTVHETDDM